MMHLLYDRCLRSERRHRFVSENNDFKALTFIYLNSQSKTNSFISEISYFKL